MAHKTETSEKKKGVGRLGDHTMAKALPDAGLLEGTATTAFAANALDRSAPRLLTER